ncbi:MAG: amino acid ABC transporter permease [Clostridiales bacterium]|jgi:polar amino acid transport system permease protein|nr:amino acid ABC transporter permease [Clostridiales bacterium]
MSFFEITLILFQGFLVTLRLFALTLLFSLPLGLIISFGSMSKFKLFSIPTKTFVWIIRGTPLMLQIIVVFYVPGMLFNYPIFKDDRFLAALITFVINYAAYFSEIYRGGIESVPKGQYEAGQVLGLTKTQTFFKVVLMQVVKHILPPISNEVITLVKDTSLIRVIAIVELINAAERFIAKEALLWPLFYTGVFYLAFCGILTLFFNFVEKKLDYYKT